MEVFGETRSLTQEEVALRFKMLRYKVYETEIGRIFGEFKKAGFEPILIKGWAAAQSYPQPFQREFTDIDLMFDPESFDEVLKFSEKIGGNFPVDLHRGA